MTGVGTLFDEFNTGSGFDYPPVANVPVLSWDSRDLTCPAGFPPVGAPFTDSRACTIVNTGSAGTPAYDLNFTVEYFDPGNGFVFRGAQLFDDNLAGPWVPPASFWTDLGGQMFDAPWTLVLACLPTLNASWARQLFVDFEGFVTSPVTDWWSAGGSATYTDTTGGIGTHNVAQRHDFTVDVSSTGSFNRNRYITNSDGGIPFTGEWAPGLATHYWDPRAGVSELWWNHVRLGSLPMAASDKIRQLTDADFAVLISRANQIPSDLIRIGWENPFGTGAVDVPVIGQAWNCVTAFQVYRGIITHDKVDQLKAQFGV